MRRSLIVASIGLCVALGAAAAAALGPPIACHPVAIEKGAALPWDQGGKPTRKNVTLDSIVKDFEAAVRDQPGVLVRMEALRRAAAFINGHGNERSRQQAVALLFGAIAAKALDGEAAGKPDAKAWFDAGFLVQCCAQSGTPLQFGAGIAETVAGYAYVKRGVELARASKDERVAEMEFGAALMTHPVMRKGSRKGEPGVGGDIYDAHLRAAVAGAESGSLLEQNLEAHLANWGGSLDRVRAQARADGAADAGKRSR